MVTRAGAASLIRRLLRADEDIARYGVRIPPSRVIEEQRAAVEELFLALTGDHPGAEFMLAFWGDE